MNPFDLDATGLMVWGLVAHLIADWPLQNDWMARNKAWPWGNTLGELLAPFTHATIHAVPLILIFGWWPGIVLGAAHLLIDTRIPVVWWSTLVRQTQPGNDAVWAESRSPDVTDRWVPVYDIGTEVRFWTDQVFHIATIAAAALTVGALT